MSCKSKQVKCPSGDYLCKNHINLNDEGIWLYKIRCVISAAHMTSLTRELPITKTRKHRLSARHVAIQGEVSHRWKSHVEGRGCSRGAGTEHEQHHGVHCHSEGVPVPWQIPTQAVHVRFPQGSVAKGRGL
jgi:hypothetical protein